VGSAALVRAANLHVGAGLVQQAPQRTRATPALNAAPKTAVNLARAARQFVPSEGNADIMVTQHVARTDDHEAKRPRVLVARETIATGLSCDWQWKTRLLKIF
jgi:hypothetical protein